jgi:hypothetical protein
MSSVFISYRRQDATTEAGRIYSRLVKSFGRDGVFKDLDSTSPGANFVHVIRRTIAMCDVLPVVIGPRWLQKHDGVSRLNDPRDWVRIEIRSALDRSILVIPILVEGATMPAEADLPEELGSLASYQALCLTEAGWRSELTRLVRTIRAHQRALDDPGVPLAIRETAGIRDGRERWTSAMREWADGNLRTFTRLRRRSVIG